MSRTAFLRLEWLLSAALILVSFLWAWVRDLPLATLLVPTVQNVVIGMVAGALLWITIPLVLRAPSMQRVWNEVLLPFSGTLGPRDVAVIAALSGVTEELFFRGVLMPEIGVVLSSLCFGALHALCAVYFAWATLVGAGFGALALAGGSLVTPIVAHATYNLGALLWLRRSARTTVPPSAPGIAATIASPHGIG
ncbi:MAG: CPBP family glutamic-type intramembrane protease [Candidatus Binatia bacterium]